MAKKKARKKSTVTAKQRPSTADGCARVFASLSGYIDPKLRKEMCANLEEHLGECDACIHFLHSLCRTVRQIEKKSPPGATAIAGMRRTILQQYRAALKTIPKPNAGGSAGV